VTVPWTNKDIAIEYKTFRDKTQPGSEEKWTVKLSGYKKDKVAAEMLASMYDASLDQFYPHYWNTPAVWENYFPYANWNSNRNFERVQNIAAYLQQQGYLSFDKRYDNFFFDELNTYYGMPATIRIRGMVSAET